MQRYHPRSNKHSNALCETLLSDLLDNCRAIARHAASGELVADLNFKIAAGATDWNIDLVLGEASGAVSPPPVGSPIKRERPSLVRLGVEAKSVMTEHRKASRNRQRDLMAFHQHLHQYNEDAIAAGIVVLNVAQTFISPLRNKQTECPQCGHVFKPSLITTHRKPEELVGFGVNLLRNLPVRTGTQRAGLDALGVLVVDYTNAPGATCRVLHSDPAPRVGDPLHYDHFVRRICQQYTRRFSKTQAGETHDLEG